MARDQQYEHHSGEARERLNEALAAYATTPSLENLRALQSARLQMAVSDELVYGRLAIRTFREFNVLTDVEAMIRRQTPEKPKDNTVDDKDKKDDAEILLQQVTAEIEKRKNVEEHRPEPADTPAA